MGLESDYKKALKKFQSAYVAGNVGKDTFTMLSVTNRLDASAKKLDNAGDLDLLRQNADQFAEQMVHYGNVVTARLRKEGREAKRALETAWRAFDKTAADLLNKHEKKIAQAERKQTMHEEMAEKANQRKLQNAFKEFSDRRDFHLASAQEGADDCVNHARSVGNILKNAGKSLNEVIKAKTDGDAGGAAGKAAEIRAGLDTARGHLDQAHATNTFLVDEFQQDRNLRFTSYKDKYDLPADMERAFQKLMAAKKGTFTTAVNVGKKAVQLIKQIEKDVDRLEDLAGQADDFAAEGQDIAALNQRLRDDWTVTRRRTTRAVLEDLFETLENKLGSADGAIGRARDILNRLAANPGQAEQLKKALSVHEDITVTNINDLGLYWDRLERRFKMASASVPNSHKDDKTIKAAQQAIIKRLAKDKKSNQAINRELTRLLAEIRAALSA